MQNVHRPLCAALGAGLLAGLTGAQTIFDDAGWTDLSERLSGAVPTGAGVVVGQVEVDGPGYVPNTGMPEFAGKTFDFVSGPSVASSHATKVGKFFYGLGTSLSPGIDDIHNYDAFAWLGSDFLQGTGALLPLQVPEQVMSHSWVASSGGTGNPYLRKLDYAIVDQNLIVTYGVLNGSQPLNGFELLAQGFNGIAVGRSDGNHGHGPTEPAIDAPGRMKPEIVAPGGASSYATPIVGGAASLLLDAANTHPGLVGNVDAQRPETVKAVLMAGAEKRAGWTNGAPNAGPDRGKTATPLDVVYGADELDVNQSHWILTSLEQPGAATHVGSTTVGQRGWSLSALSPGESRFWRFVVSVDKPLVDVVASWNRTVTMDFASWEMPAVDLRLWRIDASDALVSLVGDAATPFFSSGNVVSESTVDSVELLHLKDLAPGEYALELVRLADGIPMDWDVALAWSMSCPSAVTYCTPKLASVGCLPQIDTRGFASASDPNVFEVRAAGVVSNKNGLLFYGFAPAALPFLGGTLCVLPPLRRTTLQNAGGNTPPDDCSGTYTFDMRTWIQGGSDPNLLPGVDVFAQYWFRDPAAGGGTGLSNATRFALCQ